MRLHGMNFMEIVEVLRWKIRHVFEGRSERWLLRQAHLTIWDITALL